MSLLIVCGAAIALLAWPVLYVFARVWPEHPEYPWKVKHPREEVLTVLWCAPPLGLALLALGILA